MQKHNDQFRITLAIVTSIHPDFDSRIWKHAKSMANTGHEVHLICPWNVTDGESQDGVKFHTFSRVQSRKSRPILIPLRVARKLFPLLRQVDIIHFHDIDILPYMALLALFKHVVYDVHENYAEEMLVRDWVPRYLKWPLYWLVKWGQFIASLLVRNIVLVAPSQEESFDSNWFQKMYLYNYASVELLDHVCDDYEQRSKIVIFTGSQYLNNGTMLLLDIASETIKISPHVVFQIPDRFASTAFRQKALSEICSRGLFHHVKLIPNVKPHELIHVLNKAMIAITPNLRVVKQEKAIPTKIFEYMAAGLPIVASNLPHQLQVIEGSKAGIMASPENPQTFVDAIIQLVNNKDRAKELGQNGQKAFKEQYSWESQIPSLNKFYEQIMLN